MAQYLLPECGWWSLPQKNTCKRYSELHEMYSELHDSCTQFSAAQRLNCLINVLNNVICLVSVLFNANKLLKLMISTPAVYTIVFTINKYNILII